MTEYIYSILKKYYGYDSFKSGQEPVIKSIVSGRDALAVMPTGAGKSICYQVPALAFSGITIVISPLISLMKDQVMALNQMGVRAAYLNSTLSFKQYLKAIDNARNNMYKIIYVAPERLNTEAFLSFSSSANISLIAVDEAHCISQWGQDFRPSYLLIGDYIKSFTERPVVAAFTATATQSVKTDIKHKLGLNDPFEITTSFDRPNLYFSTAKPQSKDQYLIQQLKEWKDDCGIVYCMSRKLTMKVAELLQNRGFKASYYHAGMDTEERNKVQEDFTYDRVQIIVATSAFGMGIDKSNVRYVIHYNMPTDMESYYQEAGRAGRDGAEGNCLLLYNGSDYKLGQFIIDKGIEDNQEIDENQRNFLKGKAYERLNNMQSYSTGSGCLRKKILGYFGEIMEKNCGSCSGCNVVKEELTHEGLLFLRAVDVLKSKYGLGMVSDFLMGKENEKLVSWHCDRSIYFGALQSFDKKEISNLARWLDQQGYIQFATGQYPIISLTAQGENEVAKASGEVFASGYRFERNTASKKPTISVLDPVLFDKLKTVRRQLADKQSIPPFAVFSDAVLRDMAATKPKTMEEFLALKGVGNVKADKYGEIFIEVVNSY